MALPEFAINSIMGKVRKLTLQNAHVHSDVIRIICETLIANGDLVDIDLSDINVV
jgi:hypothetical protein